jgi:sec-independent protein translocase protein TatA
MFRNPTTDLIVVLVIVLLFFGPKRLPALGRDLGAGLREFKDSITGGSDKHEEPDAPALERGGEAEVSHPRSAAQPTAPPAPAAERAAEPAEVAPKQD